MNYRRLLLVAGSVVLALVLLLGAVFWISARPVTAGPAGRSVQPWSVTGLGRFDAQTTFDASALPTCADQERPIDAVLVIDRSASMANNSALVQAIDAAVAYAEVLSSASHRTGTVVFNDTAQTLTSLGAGIGDLRINAAGLRADSGTIISAGLSEARSVLRAGRRPGAAQVVVLLSDGGAQDAAQATEQALLLKAEGVYLITVALPGGEAVPGLLESLASSSLDHYQVSNLPDLATLFRDLARNVRQAVATDVRVVQPFPAAHFTVDANSVAPTGGAVSESAIEWYLPAMSADGVMLGYTLNARTLGWHSVAATEGTMTMIDCAGTMATFVLPLGPKVLVSPLPPWLWPLLPLFFFVPLFIFGRGRTKGVAGVSVGSDGPVDFDFREKAAGSTWLDDLPELPGLGRPRSAIEYPDALIVGVGPAGSAVLGELRRLLLDQNEEQMPGQIRLLAIRAAIGQDRPPQAVPAGQSPGASSLAPDEQLVLAPNLERVAEQLQSGDPAWAHLQWWREHTPDDPGRAGARMALFYDLMLGEGQSQVWRALRKRLGGLQQPLVYVVAGLGDGVESGMALDLPHFIKEAAGELGTGTRRVMAVFMLQRTGSKAQANVDAGRYTYAAVRELQRILLREPFAFQYNPLEGGKRLVGSTESTPIDACYLVDGVGEKIDLSALPEEQAVYPAVADALLTLLSSSVAQWHQDYVNTLPTVSRRTEESTGLPTVSSFNCAVVQFPLAGISRIAKYRFLLDLIFGGSDGKAPLGIARLELGVATHQLEARSGLDGLEPRQRAMAFLKDGGRPNRHPLMRTVAQILDNEQVEEPQLARLQPGDRRIDDAFRWALRDELLLILNGASGNVITSRSGKVGGGLAFLAGLTELLKDAESLVPRRIVLVRQPELRQEMVTRVSNWRRTAENTWQEARLWEQTLVGAPAASEVEAARARRRRAAEAKRDDTPGTVYDRFLDGLESAQAALLRAGLPTLRTLVDADSASQEEVYQRYLGPQLLRSSGLRPLEMAMARIGWQANIPDDRDVIQLRIVVAPPATAGKALDRYRSVFRPDQGTALGEALEGLAHHFLPLLREERLAEHLQKLGAAKLTQTLLQGERPLAKFDRTAINKLGGTISSHLVLTLSDQEIREQVEGLVRQDHAITAPVQAVDSDDPYRAALVGLTDAVPAASLDAVDLASLDYASDFLAQVFSAEQAAARLERDWRTRRGFDYRFHPRFVRLLDNEDLVQALGLAELYGLITRQRANNLDRASLKLTSNGTLTTVELAVGERLTPYDILYQAYHAWLKASPDQRLSRSNWPRTLAAVQATLAEQRAAYADLYAYLETRRDEFDERFESKEPKRPVWVRDVDAYLWLLAEREKQSALND